MTELQTIKVAVLYEDLLLRAGLIAVLRAQPDFEVVDANANECVLPEHADVALCDYEVGLGFLGRATPPRQRVASVLVLTARDSEREIRHALSSGVRGYVLTGCGPHELLDAIRRVGRGARYVSALAAERLADSVAGMLLTEREMDVVRMLMDGSCNKGIARRLDITSGTVKSHLRSIFQKLDARNRTEVVVVARRRGLLAALPGSGRTPEHEAPQLLTRAASALAAPKFTPPAPVA
jgi:DNA-binding NarL/FixJ family response regulator